MRTLARLASVAAIAMAMTFAAEAATVAKVSEDALQPLRKAGRSGSVRLDALPLEEGRGATVTLEEFQVWAPGGKILVHRESGIEELDPPKTRYFRGSVNGDHQSFAFFAVDAKGRVEGLVVTRESKYAIAAQARPKLQREAARDEVDHFVTRFEAEDEAPSTTEASWACAVDKMPVKAPQEEKQPDTAVQSAAEVVSNGISGTQSYEITLEIETDFNLYQNSGSNMAALTAYVTNLTGAVSTIYNRDLNTNVLQKYLNIYTTNALDPWTSTNSTAGMYELGRVYHDATKKPAGRRTSAVVMLSGVNYGGGIAWEGVIGRNDFQFTGNNFFDFNGDGVGEWGGPYSWSGGIANFGTVGLGSIPDPNATANGTLYGMPAGIQNYWPLTEYAHELGHNMGGHHTHCVAISDSERVAAGFTDGSPATSASNFVDHCYANEMKAGCFGGASGLGEDNNYKAGSAGAFKGTIMSYCHNVRVSNVPQSRFVFGVANEPSQHELTDYMLRPQGPGAGGGTHNIVKAIDFNTDTFSMSAISAPEVVAPNSTGNVASIVATPSTGATYAWTIVNGTITSSDTTSSITFTAGATGEVILRVSAYKPNKVGLTDSRIVPIGSPIVLEAPTGFVAAPTNATSVAMSWNAVADATAYEIFRASLAGNFVSIGTSSVTSYNDATASSGTAYLYKVRATAGDVTGPDSASDLATAVVFTDATLTVGSTKARLVHFTELFSAVNAVRTLAGLPAISFTTPSPATNVTIRRAHLEDLRSGLDAARSILGMPALSYTDGTITAGATKVKAVHVTQLRNGVF